MLTRAAQAATTVAINRTVLARNDLARLGVAETHLRARISAARWQLVGKAVVRHNGSLTRDEQWEVAVINVGPRALLTAFTAAERAGLTGWERDQIHVLAPRAHSRLEVPGLSIRLHQARRWLAANESSEPPVDRPTPCQPLAPALLRAAKTFSSGRPACGIVAAAIQQGLVTPASMTDVLRVSIRTKHRAVLLAAVADMAGGSQALSEIDFVLLCRAQGLPEPVRQLVRRDSNGRRRYLDASWRRASDGRLVVAEVDGALHLSQKRWWDDQLRQNELSLADALVLRFPSVIVRTEPALVGAQLRRALTG
jgi:hypothetical protein